MREFFIPTNAPLWHVLLVYAVAAAVLGYLLIDRLRKGRDGNLLGLCIRIDHVDVPDEVRTRDPLAGKEVCPIGRIVHIERPWYTLELEEPWVMWRGTVKTVKVHTESGWTSIARYRAYRIPVILDVGVGTPLQATASVASLLVPGG